MFKDYIELAKPRMVLGNDLVAAAAFIFASRGAVEWPQFWLMLTGLSLVMGSACVFNNVHDRSLDARMARTKTRALAAGRIKPAYALALGTALLAGGIVALYYINLLALGAALAGWIVYVLVYTPLKPRTPLALFAGALAGATPPLVGYAAAAHMLDWWAFALFMFMFLWQIPHFLAIARYRYDEYAAAGVPVLTAKPANEGERQRARIIFFSSLVVLLLFCAVLVVV